MQKITYTQSHIVGDLRQEASVIVEGETTGDAVVLWKEIRDDLPKYYVDGE